MINFLMHRRSIVALLISVPAFLHSAVSGADTLLLRNDPDTEQYAGRVISADKDGIVFDVECSGRQEKFSWSVNKSPEIRFNDECNKKIVVRYWGYAYGKSICNNDGKFEISANISGERKYFYVSKFSYASGVLKVENLSDDLLKKKNNIVLSKVHCPVQ